MHTSPLQRIEYIVTFLSKFLISETSDQVTSPRVFCVVIITLFFFPRPFPNCCSIVLLTTGTE